MTTAQQISARYDDALGTWCLVWRTPIMTTSAYWYFDSEQEAIDAGDNLQSGATWKVQHHAANTTAPKRIDYPGDRR